MQPVVRSQNHADTSAIYDFNVTYPRTFDLSTRVEGQPGLLLQLCHSSVHRTPPHQVGAWSSFVNVYKTVNVYSFVNGCTCSVMP